MATCEACGQDMRCPSTHNDLRCCGVIGHHGAHWADVGKRNAVLRWGMVGMGCTDPACNRPPGHNLPHRDGKGMSWAPVDEPKPKSKKPTR